VIRRYAINSDWEVVKREWGRKERRSRYVG
jgi:hypothetical protein